MLCTTSYFLFAGSNYETIFLSFSCFIHVCLTKRINDKISKEIKRVPRNADVQVIKETTYCDHFAGKEEREAQRKLDYVRDKECKTSKCVLWFGIVILVANIASDVYYLKT